MFLGFLVEITGKVRHREGLVSVSIDSRKSLVMLGIEHEASDADKL